MVTFLYINEKLSRILVEGEPEATVNLIKAFVPDLVDIDTGYTDFIDEGKTYHDLLKHLSLCNITYCFVDRVYSNRRLIDTVISEKTALTRYERNAGKGD